jgi:hypothetical protein
MNNLIKTKALLLVPLLLATGCANDLHGNYRKSTYFSMIYSAFTEPPGRDEGCRFNDLTLDKNRIIDTTGKFWAADYLSCSELLKGTTWFPYLSYDLLYRIKQISEEIKAEKFESNKKKLQKEMDNILNRYFPVVSVSSLPKENSKEDGKSITNLSDHGQESLIHELANLSKTGGKSANGDAAKNLLKALSTEFKPEEQKGPVNLTLFDRWLYVTVKEPKILAPADRIVKTIVTITLQNPTKDENSEDNIPARFVSWDKAVTAYESIEQGEIKTELTNKAELTAKVAPPATAPVDASLEGKLAREFTRSETLPVKQGSEQLTVNIECLEPQFDLVSDTDKSNETKRKNFSKIPTKANKDCDDGVLNTLSISKRSVTGGQPLTGTTQVAVKIKLGNFDDVNDSAYRNIKAVSIGGFDNYHCNNSDSDACLNERQDKLTFQDITLVNPNFINKPLKANLDINFVIRHVKSGWDTYEEGDDDIELIQFNDQRNKANPIILLRSEIPHYYGIFTFGKPLLATYDNDIENGSYICYESMAEAKKFIDFYRRIVTADSDLVPGLRLTPSSSYTKKTRYSLSAKPVCGDKI